MPADETRIAKQLGEAVRRLRTEAGLSQIQLSEHAGLNHNFLGEIERGEKLASIVTVVRLARGLGIHGDELLRRAKL